MAKVIVPYYHSYSNTIITNYPINTSSSSASVSTNFDGSFAYSSDVLHQQITLGGSPSSKIVTSSTYSYFTIINTASLYYGLLSYRYITLNFTDLGTFTNNTTSTKYIRFILKNVDKKGVTKSWTLKTLTVPANRSITPANFTILIDTTSTSTSGTDVTSPVNPSASKKAVVPKNWIKSGVAYEWYGNNTHTYVTITPIDGVDNDDSDLGKSCKYLGCNAEVTWNTLSGDVGTDDAITSDIELNFDNISSISKSDIKHRFLCLTITGTPCCKNTSTSFTRTFYCNLLVKTPSGSKTVMLNSITVDKAFVTSIPELSMPLWADGTYWIDLVEGKVIDANKAITSF